jgi:glycerol kinase
MKTITAIDQGTTSTRCILFDREGQPVARAQQEHRQIHPRPGWVEHDPVEIWARTLGVMAEAWGFAKCEPGDLAAIGITNQRETKVIREKASLEPSIGSISTGGESKNSKSGRRRQAVSPVIAV